MGCRKLGISSSIWPLASSRRLRLSTSAGNRRRYRSPYTCEFARRPSLQLPCPPRPGPFSPSIIITISVAAAEAGQFRSPIMLAVLPNKEEQERGGSPSSTNSVSLRFFCLFFLFVFFFFHYFYFSSRIVGLASVVESHASPK